MALQIALFPMAQTADRLPPFMIASGTRANLQAWHPVAAQMPQLEEYTNVPRLSRLAALVLSGFVVS
jgi:hypothetical protein